MIYQIEVQGNIDSSWSDWFNGMQISVKPGDARADVTTLSGYVSDQASLRGLLNHLWDLNLSIFSVIRLDTIRLAEAYPRVPEEGSKP